MKIQWLRILKDNYVWLLSLNKHNIIVVDPGESSPITQWLSEHQCTLAGVLLTHDHVDHVGGLEALKKAATFPIYGLCRFTNQQDKKFLLSDTIAVEMIETPGHTEKSVCYLITDEKKQKHLFCGDTLFSVGCGRVFTGDYIAMFHSLEKLNALDDACLVYPGHEYTLNNLAFAQWLEPDNIHLNTYAEAIKKKWMEQGNTLPSTMKVEKEINPFLRYYNSDLVQSVSQKAGRTVQSGLDCFTELRKLKDYYQA